ncbi:MAG: hypothetical protein H8E57_07965 [Candidatus Cloacimonetes bacterium]|nr:hypothetical protein [Candidatus Cloacimonadota bacterium]
MKITVILFPSKYDQFQDIFALFITDQMNENEVGNVSYISNPGNIEFYH